MSDDPGMPDEVLRAPALYQRLRRLFGTVLVGKPGERFTWRLVVTPRGARAQVGDIGEVYRFNCPYCGDTRRRAWVGHYFGQPDPVSPDRRLTGLVGCWNEECFREPGRKDEFLLQLLGVAGARSRLPPCEVDDGPPRPRGAVTLPGCTVSLRHLPAVHPARQYVLGRGFDPDALARDWDVGYCMDATAPHEAGCLHRLVIPFRRHGELVGWQARRLSDSGGGRKYLNHTGGLAGYLYGMDRAAGGRLAVLVEGAPSVWSLGPPAMAVLGSALGPVRLGVLKDFAARDGLAVVLFDPGAEAKAAAAYADLLPAFPGRVAVAALPERVEPGACRRWPIPKVDPGELTSVEAWAAVVRAVDAIGLRLEDFLA